MPRSDNFIVVSDDDDFRSRLLFLSFRFAGCNVDETRSPFLANLALYIIRGSARDLVEQVRPLLSQLFNVLGCPFIKLALASS